MKPKFFTAASVVVFVLALTAPAAFAGSGHDMDHGGHMGKEIHMSMVDGHHLAYHLIDMKEKMAGAEGMTMKGHDMGSMKSHHMMLYLVGPDGKKLTKGKVGYKVENPDGTVQKAMAMAMNGAFGADVDFKAKGTYTIKTKVIAGDKKVIDSFSYKVD